MISLLRNKKGLSIATAMIVVMIIALVSTYGYGYYQNLCLSMGRLNNRFIAINLAIAQAEDLIAMDWDDGNIHPPPINNHIHTLTKQGQTDPVPGGFTLTYSVEPWLPGSGSIGMGANLSPCKRLTVTCTYPPANNSIQLRTYKVDVRI